VISTGWRQEGHWVKNLPYQSVVAVTWKLSVKTASVYVCETFLSGRPGRNTPQTRRGGGFCGCERQMRSVGRRLRPPLLLLLLLLLI